VFEHTQIKKTRLKIMIRAALEDGEERLFFVFPLQGSRVLDLLNDDRRFLPVENADGSIELIRKDFIRSVIPMENPAREGRGPYQVLGVSETATDAEVRAAYHRVIAPVHPDHIMALNLPHDFVQLANRIAAQTNEAYAKIKRLRGMPADGGDFGT
jgi:DnaJ-domain-containing protein 1